MRRSSLSRPREPCGGGLQNAEEPVHGRATHRRSEGVGSGYGDRGAVPEAGISFHGKFREECLNEHWFLTLDDARQTIESWRLDYNRVRLIAPWAI